MNADDEIVALEDEEDVRDARAAREEEDLTHADVLAILGD
jgi:hypothetical protein